MRIILKVFAEEGLDEDGGYIDVDLEYLEYLLNLIAISQELKETTKARSGRDNFYYATYGDGRLVPFIMPKWAEMYGEDWDNDIENREWAIEPEQSAPPDYDKEAPRTDGDVIRVSADDVSWRCYEHYCGKTYESASLSLADLVGLRDGLRGKPNDASEEGHDRGKKRRRRKRGDA